MKKIIKKSKVDPDTVHYKVLPPGYEIIQDILAERKRLEVNGFTLDQDRNGMFSDAAAALLLYEQEIAEDIWPFDSEFNPKDHRDNFVRAGALILAEIESLDRAFSWWDEDEYPPEVQAAIDLYTPKKPLNQFKRYGKQRGYCPSCDRILDDQFSDIACGCGQRLDWSDHD